MNKKILSLIAVFMTAGLVTQAEAQMASARAASRTVRCNKTGAYTGEHDALCATYAGGDKMKHTCCLCLAAKIHCTQPGHGGGLAIEGKCSPRRMRAMMERMGMTPDKMAAAIDEIGNEIRKANRELEQVDESTINQIVKAEKAGMFGRRARRR